MAGTALLLSALTSPAGASTEGLTPPGSDYLTSVPALGFPSSLERRMLDLVNADRAAHGLAPLSFDLELLAVARTRAAAQAPLPSLSHYDAQGRLAIREQLAASGTTYTLAGENLARLTAPEATAAEQAQVALMNSPTHRRNLLDGTFDRLAVGAVQEPSGRIIFAQIFRAS